MNNDLGNLATFTLVIASMGNKLFGVIDVGSNSVRLMLHDGKHTLNKTVAITHLAQGLKDGVLDERSIYRTVDAVCAFVDDAKRHNVTDLFVFATAAVRKAVNGQRFKSLVFERCGVNVDVVSGQLEAELGRLGALGKNDGGVIDIGGASTEITVSKNGKKIYGTSVYVGTVALNDQCGQDESKLGAFIEEVIKGYGLVPSSNFKAIGGTATSIAAVMQGLEPYDPTKIDGFAIDKKSLYELKDRVFKMTLEQKESLKGLQKGRAGVFAGGVLLLIKLMEMLKINSVVVSESDNLEGYLAMKVGL